jgi:hypothetical protein
VIKAAKVQENVVVKPSQRYSQVSNAERDTPTHFEVLLIEKWKNLCGQVIAVLKVLHFPVLHFGPSFCGPVFSASRPLLLRALSPPAVIESRYSGWMRSNDDARCV